MRRCLILYGLTSVITLTLLAREIALLFGGVELLLLVALGVWLIWAALGCGLIGRALAARRISATGFALLFAIAGALAPLTLLAIRLVPTFCPPQRADLLQAVLVCGATLLPLGVAGGLLLALSLVISLRSRERPAAVAVETISFLAAGGFLGGLLVTYLLPGVAPAQVLAGIASLHCLAAFFVWFNAPRRTELGWLFIPLVATGAIVAVSPVGAVLDFLSQTWLYPGRTLHESEDVSLGRAQVLIAGSNTEYYLNGALVATQGEGAPAERRMLLPLLAHPLPRRLLVIAPAPNDSLAAALKLPWLPVDYLPLNDDLARSALRHASPALQKAFDLPRLRLLWDLDPAIFLQNVRGRYDVVCLELPSAAPGAFSRFMTTRFLALARGALADGGLLVVSVPGRGTSADTLLTAAAVAGTLRSRNATLFAIRSESAVLLLSYPRRGAVLPQPAELTGRMARWNLRGAPLRDSDIARALDRKQAAQTAAAIKRALPSAPGTEQRPLPWRLASTAWAQTLKAQGLGPLGDFLKLDLLSALMAALLLSGAVALWGTFATAKAPIASASGLLCSAGAAAATALSGLLILQSRCGVALPDLGLLLGVALAGLGLGALLAAAEKGSDPFSGRADTEKVSDTFSLPSALLLVAQALCAALGGAAWLLVGLAAQASAYVVGICLALGIAFVAGALLGARLPLSISLAAETEKVSDTFSLPVARKTLGVLACACLGAGLAALLCGAALAAPLGPARTAFAAAFLALVPLPLTALSLRGARWRRGYRQSSALYTGAAQQARTTYHGSLRLP